MSDTVKTGSSGRTRTMKTTQERREVNQPFASLIKHYRKAAKLQQHELAGLLGVKSNAVSNWETGLSRPDLGDIPALCRILNITPNVFFSAGDDGAPDREEQELLLQYRALDARGRTTVRQVVQAELSSQKASRWAAGMDLKCYRTAAAAGYGSYLPEDEEYDLLRLDCTPETCRASFVIPLAGDSMEPTLHNGDRLLIHRTEVLSPGQIGVFVFDGESYVKELGEGCLISHNPAYAPIAVGLDQPLHCVGRVLGVLDESHVIPTL